MTIVTIEQEVPRYKKLALKSGQRKDAPRREKRLPSLEGDRVYTCPIHTHVSRLQFRFLRYMKVHDSRETYEPRPAGQMQSSGSWVDPDVPRYKIVLGPKRGMPAVTSSETLGRFQHVNCSSMAEYRVHMDLERERMECME